MTTVIRGKGGTSRGDPTIYDVAAVADVSAQTVSRYLRGYTGIKPETRERVESALLQLNYRPNLTARFLSTAKSNRIAALAHEFGEVGSSQVIASATRAARDAGYVLDVISLDVRDQEAVERAILLIDQRELAGVIAFAPTFSLIEAFASAEITVPVYIYSDRVDEERGDVISRDGASVRLLVDHLVELGHTAFVHVAGPLGWVSAYNRELAYSRALSAHRLTSRGTMHGDWSSTSGYELGLMLATHQDATAIVVANDQMALGVMRALHDSGVRVPQDVSVVGFDDIAEAKYFTPSLTTATVDFDTNGRTAIAQILSMMPDEHSEPLVPEKPLPRLHLRESSASPAESSRRQTAR